MTNIDDYISHARGVIVRGRRISMGRVPFTEYWLMNGKKYLGTIQIRHQPSGRHEDLKSHIYYHIIPSERGKGYGTTILKLGLQEARKLGLSEVLLTTNATNGRSRSVIETCGGVLLKKIKVPGEKAPMLQYKISIKGR